MRLDINGKAEELKFNYEFIERMDKAYGENEQIKNLGIGLAVGVNMLENTYSPKALADIIYAATNGVSKKDIIQSIEDYADEYGDLETLFEEVIDEIKKAPMLKATLKKVNKLIQQQDMDVT